MFHQLIYCTNYSGHTLNLINSAYHTPLAVARICTLKFYPKWSTIRKLATFVLLLVRLKRLITFWVHMQEDYEVLISASKSGEVEKVEELLSNNLPTSTINNIGICRDFK